MELQIGQLIAAPFLPASAEVKKLNPDWATTVWKCCCAMAATSISLKILVGKETYIRGSAEVVEASKPRVEQGRLF
jgi:hypothetical protein